MTFSIYWPNGAMYVAYDLQQREVNKLISWWSDMSQDQDGPLIVVEAA